MFIILKSVLSLCSGWAGSASFCLKILLQKAYKQSQNNHLSRTPSIDRWFLSTLRIPLVYHELHSCGILKFKNRGEYKTFMTKINKLVMQGFKSFADKTELVFGDTVNCVLGPNGNGKSNILDALCFVLGRTSSKSMRAEKTSHLLFDGGKKKKPSEKGQVDIYFDNGSKIFPLDSAEVKVSRIIKRNGQSTYKLNDKTHTRNEVLDLLSAARIDPNGYNIILQGDITRFVEMSSLDRRKIVEEISGISVYEERRHQAVLELEKVGQRLNDAEIILKERRTHLNELKKDRDQALKFKELKEGIDSNKATYLHIQLKRKEEFKQKFDSEIAVLQEKLKKAEEQVSGYKKLIQEKKEGIENINKEIEQKGEVEQVKLSKEIENARVELEKQKARVVMVKDAIAKIKQRKQGLEKSTKDIEQQIEEIETKRRSLEKQKENKEKELGIIVQQIDSFKKRNKIETLGDIEKDIEAVDKAAEKKQEEIQKMRQQQQELLREKDRVEYQLQMIDEQVQKVAQVEKENKSQIADLKKKKEQFVSLTSALNKCLDADSSTSVDMADIRKSLHALEEERAKLQARHVSTQERLGGNIAVKKIVGQKKPGIYGTIAELGKVTKKYSLALEMAAGSRLQSIVVQDDKIAADCIKYLRQNKFGAATFIPLNKIKAPQVHEGTKALKKQPGVHDFCVDIVTFDGKFQKAFEYVFADTLVVDDIDVARGIGIGNARMVTLQGDLADHSGVMRGGYHHKTVSSFAEADVEDELHEAERKLGSFSGTLSRLAKEKAANEERIMQLRTEKLGLEGEVVRLEKTLHLGSADLDATRQQKDELVSQLEKINGKLGEVETAVRASNVELAREKSRKEQLKLKVSQLRNPRLLAELTAFDEARQKVREEVLGLQNEINSLSLQTKNMMLPEKEKIQQLLKGHDKEFSSFTSELSGLTENIKREEEVLKEKEQKQRKFFSAYKELFHVRDKLSGEASAAEDKQEMVRDQSRRAEIEMNNLSLKRAAVVSELSGLEAQMQPLQNAKLLKGRGEEELKAEISKFEKLLSAMSAVNMKALEVYEQVEVEYGKLIEKKETLLKEKQDVVGLMEEIESKKKDQFMKTFDEINKNFNEKFMSLTKKGRAYLHLENPQKLFDGGMDIRINIAGKRHMDIRSLSGGEKTMTALAFYFAVQEHEPHSFYLMDEVDASLDKHNSERLAQLIKQYCKNAQYIVISHNDALISESDHLYGVSMDEVGVSKVVSLKV